LLAIRRAPIWEEWEAEKREQFEERWPTLQRIMDEFEQVGIYLMDVSQAIIVFEETPSDFS
jgi:hypothetical protein